MRKYYFSLLMICSMGTAHAQNVGIGTGAPFTKLHVKDSADNGLITYFENISPDGNGSAINLRSTVNGTAFQNWYLGSGIFGIGQTKFGIGGSSPQFVIDTSGNVGIGTSNPITRLSNFTTNMIGSDGIGVNTSSLTWGMNSQGYVHSLFNAASGLGADGLAIKIAGNTAGNRLLDLSVAASALSIGTPVMVVRGDGKVGFGTSSPFTRLSNFTTNMIGSDGIGVNGPSLTWGMNTQGYVQSLFNAESNFGGNGLAVKIAGNTGSNRLLDLSVAGTALAPGTPVMIVRGDGKVAIGTNDPGAKLSLGTLGTEQRLFSLFDDYANNNAFGMGVEPNPASTGRRLMIYSGNVNETDAVTLGSYSGTTYNEALRVQANGMVGLGTTTPDARLHIVGNGLGNQLRMDDVSGVTVRINAFANVGLAAPYPYIGTTTDHPFAIITNNAYRVFVDAGGNVGIGTILPASRLHVNGTITATAPLNVVSDIRYKKNIMPLKNAMNTVRQLKGVSYQLRDDEFPDMNFPSAMQIGFIAQEVEKVLPGIVTTDKTGHKSMSYTSVIPLLVEAIKEQQQEIDTLKQLVEDLLKSKNK